MLFKELLLLVAGLMLHSVPLPRPMRNIIELLCIHGKSWKKLKKNSPCWYSKENWILRIWIQASSELNYLPWYVINTWRWRVKCLVRYSLWHGYFVLCLHLNYLCLLIWKLVKLGNNLLHSYWNCFWLIKKYISCSWMPWRTIFKTFYSWNLILNLKECIERLFII